VAAIIRRVVEGGPLVSHGSVYALLVDFFGSNLRGEQQTLHYRLSSIVRVAELRAEAASEEHRRLVGAEAVLTKLRTEEGRVAFALDNGWPLPEELLAAKARVKELEAELRNALGEIRAYDALSTSKRGRDAE
jgi:hypothetical protein